MQEARGTKVVLINGRTNKETQVTSSMGDNDGGKTETGCEAQKKHK